MTLIVIFSIDVGPNKHPSYRAEALSTFDILVHDSATVGTREKRKCTFGI